MTAEQNLKQEFTQWRLDNALALQASNPEARNSTIRLKLHELGIKYGVK